MHAFQVVLRRKDGALRQHILYADRIETGEGKAMIVAYVDVTDSRRAEAELRASEETRHAIFSVPRQSPCWFPIWRTIIRWSMPTRPGCGSSSARCREILGATAGRSISGESKKIAGGSSA